MGFNCGIIGLPNAGKSTIFNALTSAKAQVANYPFTTIDKNIGIVPVPDDRLPRLARIFGSETIKPTTLKFTDIAGLVRGAHKGEGLGNMFLGHIRDVDALIHVVRCFEDPDVAHVYGSIDPLRDIEIVNTELALADLETLDRRLQKLEKRKKTGEKGLEKVIEFLKKVRELISQGKGLHQVDFPPEEEEIMRDLHLLRVKPVLYVLNVDENIMTGGDKRIESVKRYVMEEKNEVILICGKIEEEISTLSPEEREEYLHEFGFQESGLHKIINGGYRLLKLITFFTGNEKEVRAWTIPEGTRAPEAAGKIHSDMERGFIKAEVISFEDLHAAGSIQHAREKGLIRIEGRDYIVQEGDVIYFRFHV